MPKIGKKLGIKKLRLLKFALTKFNSDSLNSSYTIFFNVYESVREMILISDYAGLRLPF